MADEWWVCSSVHKLYPFLKTSVFVVENQFDTNQIYSSDGKVPKHPANASESDAAARYVGMYGSAMRNSAAQVLAQKGKRVNGHAVQPIETVRGWKARDVQV